MSETVLIICAHPDDEVLGMGGTIAALSRKPGTTVDVVCVTDGSSSQYPGNTEILESKKRAAQAAGAVLGVREYRFLDFPDMRLDGVPHPELNRALADILDESGASTLYLVHPDINRDHSTVFESSMVACRPRPGCEVRQVYAYAPMSSIEWATMLSPAFAPTQFVDITATLEAKLEAFSHYEMEEREWPHPRSAHALRVHAEYWGTRVGVAAAEPFVVVRQIVRQS